MKPADGNNYNTIIPTMTAAKQAAGLDPAADLVELPASTSASWCGTQLADLTPYLSGDNIKKYPNLAAIPTGAWQAGAWGDKLYGIPSLRHRLPHRRHRSSTAATSWRPRASPPTR